MIPITLSSIKFHFNQQAILTPAEKMQVRLLREMGALTRTIARRSIRPATSKRLKSQPGEPPVTHGGRINYRDTIYFVVDPKRKEMVCGPVLLSGTSGNGQPVPGILEDGGQELKIELNRGKPKIHRIYVRARPHMKPAFEKAKQRKLPDLIKNGIMREI